MEIHPQLRDASLAGLAGSAAATALAAVVHTFAPQVEFPPVAIAQAFVRTASGQVESFFIQRLGHWAERLAVIGTTASFALAGLVLGALVWVLTRNRSRTLAAAWVPCLLPVWAISVAVYPGNPQSLGRLAFAAATLPIYVVAGFVAARAHAGLTAPATVTDEGRRVLVRAIGFGAAGAAVGLLDIGRVLFPSPDPGRQLLRVGNLDTATPPPLAQGDEAFRGVAGLTAEITSNDAFYVIDESLVDPDIDPETWRLSIRGLVDRPGQLSYGALKRLPAVERYQTLECISNRTGGNLMSTAKWVGVPLPEILERAGVRPDAVEVVFRAAGGYSDSLSIDQAMDDSTLIAIGMNDHVLPRAHGFPARLLSVGTYGMKNPKWLTSIEVVDRPYRGFWEQRGWTKRAIVKTGSRIDVPSDGAQVGRVASIAGVAFAGDRGISRVEVSTDDGRTWSEAQLKRPLSGYTWRQWLYRWTPSGEGSTVIRARAYDGTGSLQSSEYHETYPSGATGYDRVYVSR